MPRELPKIELYMYSLNQEFPTGEGHAKYLKRHAEMKPDASGRLVSLEAAESQVFGTVSQHATDWSVQWISNEWVTNHTKAAGVGIREDIDPMLNAVLREEDFGAILFEPLSDRVFRLNRAGRALFEEMRDHYKANKRSFARFKSAKFKKEESDAFLAFMKGAGLWIEG